MPMQERMATPSRCTAQAPHSALQLTCLLSASGERRTRLFFRYWTLGESLIKATGMGLHQDLKGFAFTPDGPPSLIRLESNSGPLGHWHFGCHAPDAGPA